MSEEHKAKALATATSALMGRQKFVEWLNRRCDFGPPCGKCKYCAIAMTVNRGDFDVPLLTSTEEIEVIRAQHAEKMETVLKARRDCPYDDCPCKDSSLPDRDIANLLSVIDAQVIEIARLNPKANETTNSDRRQPKSQTYSGPIDAGDGR